MINMGVPLTDEALETAKSNDAVLLGAVGGVVGKDSWYELPPNLRPEAGLLAIRKGLNLFGKSQTCISLQGVKGCMST